MSRTATAVFCCWPLCSANSHSCANCLPTVRMPDRCSRTAPPQRCAASPCKSSNVLTTSKVSWSNPSDGSSNAPLPGSTAAVDWLRIGKTATTMRSLSSTSPRSGSCSEGSVIPHEVSGRTLSGPIPSVNLTMIAYPGSYRFRAGKRTAQRYTYSPYFPVLQFNTTEGGFIGGNFWDGRSTGYKLQSPDAEQAQHPPVDTQEHMLPDTACIAFRLTTAAYRPLFEAV